MTIPLIFVLSIIILSNFVTLKLVTKRNIRFSYQISISRSELGILKPGDSRLGLLAFKIILDYHYFNTLHNIPIHMNIIWDRLSCWSTGWHCASWFFIVKFLSHAKQNRKKNRNRNSSLDILTKYSLTIKFNHHEKYLGHTHVQKPHICPSTPRAHMEPHIWDKGSRDRLRSELRISCRVWLS